MTKELRDIYDGLVTTTEHGDSWNENDASLAIVRLLRLLIRKSEENDKAVQP